MGRSLQGPASVGPNTGKQLCQQQQDDQQLAPAPAHGHSDGCDTSSQQSELPEMSMRLSPEPSQQQQEEADDRRDSTEFRSAGPQQQARSLTPLKYQVGQEVQLVCQVSGSMWKPAGLTLCLRILGLLGRGGSAEVYRAELLSLIEDGDDNSSSSSSRDGNGGYKGEIEDFSFEPGQVFALKVPLPYTALSAADRQECSPKQYSFGTYKVFDLEQRVMGSVAGSLFIVGCLAYGYLMPEEEELPALLLDLLDEGTVLERLAPSPDVLAPMSAEKAWWVIWQVTTALSELHTKAMVAYRDLKPANILSTRNAPGQGLDYRLTDFGSCHLFAHAGDLARGRIQGTRSYLAPEQLAGAPHSVQVSSFSSRQS